MYKFDKSIVIVLSLITTSVSADENIHHLKTPQNFQYKAEPSTDEKAFQKDILAAIPNSPSNSTLAQAAPPRTILFHRRTNSIPQQQRYEPENEILTIENALERNLQP